MSHLSLSAFWYLIKWNGSFFVSTSPTDGASSLHNVFDDLLSGVHSVVENTYSIAAPRRAFRFAKLHGNPEHLFIGDGDVDDMCLANMSGALGYRGQHRLHVTWRIGDYAENVGDRRLLLQRLVPFTAKPREFCLLSVSNGRAAPGLWRIQALSRYRLAASRFNRFATFIGMPSHCPLPEGRGARLAHWKSLVGAAGWLALPFA